MLEQAPQEEEVMPEQAFPKEEDPVYAPEVCRRASRKATQTRRQ
jgi:hypothetical protein